MLTYCTNIHPGESWHDVRKNLESHFLKVKRGVSPGRPFPIGLRLSNRATEELDDDETERFRDWCDGIDGYVVTVNGFPYGTFHGTSVKERVYDPDWRDSRRILYTQRIADALARWLPDGVTGSISTVPIAFARGFDDEDWSIVRRHLLATLEHLDGHRQGSGRQMILSVEAEPRCVLESTDQLVSFFERMAFPTHLADLIGVCFDCCHQAVQFEEPAASLAKLAKAGIRIGKVQVSSSLQAVGSEIDEGLREFDEPTYLHQVVARCSDGTLLRYDDLPEFFADRARAGSMAAERIAECRVHFHVPIFTNRLGRCATTRFFLEDILPRFDPELTFEVETYSWDALPESLRMKSVADSIVRELRWAERRIGESNRRS